jgi:ABC-type nitrate/sulfonate/bicarbonate transport system substrate-binding protein
LKVQTGWAISTGSKRPINSIADLKNGKIGVSRIGSGSYVMGFVLADEQGWLSSSSNPLFEVIPLQTFEKLREGVNDSTADFFMWEHFTSKKYYDNGEIKRVGEIYTPWSSWKIVASTQIKQDDERLEEMFEKIDKGVRYFEGNKEEAVKYISTKLDYSEGDAREWLKTVKFSAKTKGVDVGVIQKTVDVLKKAGVLGEKGMKPEVMIASRRGAQVP